MLVEVLVEKGVSGCEVKVAKSNRKVDNPSGERVESTQAMCLSSVLN